MGFDPKEVFDVGSRRTAEKALRSIKVTYFCLQLCQDFFRCLFVFQEINVFDLFPNYPMSHWIYVVTNHVTPKSVSLKQRRTAAHKRVRNPLTGKIVRLIKYVALCPASKLR